MVSSQSLLIQPKWPAPNNIVAFSSCRIGGVSESPYAELNLADHVGDSAVHVAENRQLLEQQCEGLEGIQWLSQVHGTRVHNLTAAICERPPEADACYSRQTALACAVMTADCLPLLFCDEAGEQIAAVHAGWRGLATGVLEATMQHFSCEPRNIMVWLGPAIGARQFEVGVEVRDAFLVAGGGRAVEQAFVESTHRPGYYFADLYQLARLRLQRLGVNAIYGGDYCTYSDPSRFFSYRRDGVTGRMVTLIYKRR